MVTVEGFKELLFYQQDVDTRVLSIYLDVDQTQAENLNRGFERSLKNLLRHAEERLTPEEIEQFKRDAKRIEEFVMKYTPEGKSLVLFSNEARDFFWQMTLHVSRVNEIHWNSRPYVRPLLEANDEFERYGVILTDRAQARLFTMAMGEIEEDLHTLAEADVKRFEASGMDHMRSQMIFQRKADEHAKWHLKKVAGMMDRLLDNRPFERLILAGTTEAVSELKTLLPERLKDRVIATLSLPLYASEHEIQEACMNEVSRYERVFELATLNRLRTGAAKRQMAVMGLEDTLHAAVESRIRLLVYAENYGAPGSECRNCNHLSDTVVERCGNCGGRVDVHDNVLNRLVERVTHEGGNVEQMRGDAAGQLRKLGGIGAFLRF